MFRFEGLCSLLFTVLDVLDHSGLPTPAWASLVALVREATVLVRESVRLACELAFFLCTNRFLCQCANPPVAVRESWG